MNNSVILGEEFSVANSFVLNSISNTSTGIMIVLYITLSPVNHEQIIRHDYNIYP